MIELVPFDPSHFPILISWFSTEAQAVQWAGPTVTMPLNDAQLQAMLDEGRGDPPARLCWMARQRGREGDSMAGHAQLGFDWRNGNARLSRVAIAPEARGQRLARPMLTSVLARAFAFPEIERVELNVYPFNVRRFEPMRAWASCRKECGAPRRASEPSAGTPSTWVSSGPTGKGPDDVRTCSQGRFRLPTDRAGDHRNGLPDRDDWGRAPSGARVGPSNLL